MDFTSLKQAMTTCWGRSKVLASNGVLVDFTPPSFQYVNSRVYDKIGRQSRYLNHMDSFVVEWDGITDRETGVLKYEVAVCSQTNNNSFVDIHTL
jgi:hypothetical protein